MSYLQTSCSGDEFTCSDGTCVPLNFRCDLKADCSDRSDEQNCRKVVFYSDYEKDLTPKHTEKSKNGTMINKPLPVYLSVDILDFDKVDTLDMMIL